MTWHVSDIVSTLIDDHKGMGSPMLIINPSDLYPPMIAHIQEVMERVSEDEDGSIHYPNLPEIAERDSDRTGAMNLMSWAYSLPESAWQDALIPRWDSVETIEADGRVITEYFLTPEFDSFSDDDERVKNRTQALECALAWFTRALRMVCRAQNVPVPNRIITRDSDYRL